MNLFSFKPFSTEVQSMVRAYMGRLLWTMPGPDGDENPGDRFSVDRFTREARAVCLSDCLEFLNLCKRAGFVTLLYGSGDFQLSGYGPDNMGHDLALSRNGHGAGFFDRKALELDARHFRFAGATITGKTLGDELQSIADNMGDRDIYPAHGWIHVS
jgi:hypothetical protein